MSRQDLTGLQTDITRRHEVKDDAGQGASFCRGDQQIPCQKSAQPSAVGLRRSLGALQRHAVGTADRVRSACDQVLKRVGDRGLSVAGAGSNLENLESRRLLADFSAAINFQTTQAYVPGGFTPDYGYTYGDRDDGHDLRLERRQHRRHPQPVTAVARPTKSATR